MGASNQDGVGLPGHQHQTNLKVSKQEHLHPRGSFDIKPSRGACHRDTQLRCQLRREYLSSSTPPRHGVHPRVGADRLYYNVQYLRSFYLTPRHGDSLFVFGALFRRQVAGACERPWRATYQCVILHLVSRVPMAAAQSACQKTHALLDRHSNKSTNLPTPQPLNTATTTTTAAAPTATSPHLALVFPAAVCPKPTSPLQSHDHHNNIFPRYRKQRLPGKPKTREASQTRR